VAEWQKAFEHHHQASTESNRDADRVRSEIEVLDQRLLQSSRRVEALEREAGTIDTGGMREELGQLEEESGQLGGREAGTQEELDRLSTELADIRERLKQDEESRREMQRELHTREGRLESLRAMQQAALESESAGVWLESRGLESAPRLAKVITVQEGWEAAAEVALGNWLQSVVVAAGSDHGPALASLEQSAMSLLEDGTGGVKARKGSLAEKVEAPDAVMDWLNRITVTDSLESAWNQRSSLEEGASLMTAVGEWIGKGWIRVARGQSDHDSMLAREKAISRLAQEVEEQSAAATELGLEIGRSTERAAEVELRISELQSEVNALHRRRNEVDGRLESRQSSIGLMADRQKAVGEESQQLKQQIGEDQAAVREARGRLEGMLGRMAELKAEREGLDAQRSELMARRDDARNALAEARDRRHDLALKAESRRASLDSLRQSLERMDTQLSQLQQRYLSLSEHIAKAEQPDQAHKDEMDQLLKKRVETETRLAEARALLQGLENDYREKDAERQRAIQGSDEIRQNLERARLAQQEIQLNARNLQQQVDALGADVGELAESLPEEADPEAWEAELEKLKERITRLEPVNLAAIQEFEEEQKRKEYLDAQNEDLCAALSTLENAIAKIDRRTRTRFKETFERVNKGVQELFPRLFGGGHAYLELTGEDLLTTGVTIMAQPPGKRVSSLHLLSGGEKALTAVAFVFAIFRLNPAPFCLLDEVDAPLDDANVLRFSTMVSEMSESVQFIIVTHNKITMEMAHQMSGVTMREPGVSRLVQVDIEEAAALAAS
jgi:chromosome segregation protein